MFNAILLSLIIMLSSLAFAVPTGVVIKAKIIKPDGSALEASIVDFRILTLDAAGTCVLYSETFGGVSMIGSGGSVIFTLGSGAQVYSAAAAYNDIYNNLTTSYNCQAGGTATPTLLSGRKIVIQFNDNSAASWQTIDPITVTSVPFSNYAGNAEKVGGHPASDFMMASSNLSNIASASTARTNLGSTTTGDAIFTAATPAAVRTTLGLGTSSVLDVGTAANNLVQLDGTAKIPAALLPSSASLWSDLGSGNIGFNGSGTGNANVGIGIIAPLYPLHVYDAKLDPASSETALRVTQNSQITAPSSNYMYTGNFSSFLTLSSSLSGITGLQNTVSTATASSGSVGNMYGIYNTAGLASGGTTAVGNLYGIYSRPLMYSGAVTNSYNLYLASPGTGATIGSEYAIYQQSGTAANYFAGSTGIGITASTMPRAKLDVRSAGYSAGTATVSGTISTANLTTSTSMTLNAGDYIVPNSSPGQSRIIATTATGTSFVVSQPFTANVSGDTFMIYSPVVNFNNKFIVQGFLNNVGVGTVTPTAPLEVSSTSNTPLVLTRVTGTNNVAVGLGFSENDAAGTQTNIGSIFAAMSANTAGAVNGYLHFDTTTAGSLSEKMRLDSTGYLGLGTQAPAAKLHLDSSGAFTGPSLLIRNSAGGSSTFPGLDIFKYGGVGLPRIRLSNAGGIAGAATATSSGSVLGEIDFLGVGDTASVQVYAAKINALAAATFTDASTPTALTFWTTPVGAAVPLERLRIKEDGTVGIGITSPTQALDVVGNIKSSGCIYYASSSIGTCASDERIKKDVHSFDLGLKEILGIDPVLFKYNGLAGFQDDGKEQLGVIAQQVEKNAPGLIKRQMVQLHKDDLEKTEIKVVDYGAFTFVVINSIKEFYSRWFADSTQLHREIAAIKEDNLEKDLQIKKLIEENEAVKIRLEKIEKALSK